MTTKKVCTMNTLGNVTKDKFPRKKSSFHADVDLLGSIGLDRGTIGSDEGGAVGTKRLVGGCSRKKAHFCPAINEKMGVGYLVQQIHCGPRRAGHHWG